MVGENYIHIKKNKNLDRFPSFHHHPTWLSCSPSHLFPSLTLSSFNIFSYRTYTFLPSPHQMSSPSDPMAIFTHTQQQQPNLLLHPQVLLHRRQITISIVPGRVGLRRAGDVLFIIRHWQLVILISIYFYNGRLVFLPGQILVSSL